MKTDDYTQEQLFLKAEKKIKEIKAFYIHLFVYIIIIPIIIFVNLQFSPGHHWFWYAALGWGVGIFSHWFAVFGFEVLGLDSNWEKRKIEEIMENYKNEN